MSLGFGAYAHLIAQDNETVLYDYGGYNWNEPGYRNENRICDGIITISRICFAEPEIHKKTKRMSGGKKRQIVKRISVSVNYPQMIRDGLIQIENCSNCWRCSSDENVDIMALHILYRLFMQYQEEGTLPEYVCYHV